MATFEQSAADSAAAAAASAKTATDAAAKILEHKTWGTDYMTQEISKAMGTLREELAAVKRDLEQADSNLRESIAATDKNIADNYVKWTDKATTAKAGIVQVGANLSVDTAGKVSVPEATGSRLGVMRPGTNMSVTNGVLTFTLDGYRGGVNIALADGSAKIVMSANAIDIVAADNARMRATGEYAFGFLVNTGGASIIRNNDITQRGGINCNYAGVEIGRSDLSLKLLGYGIGANGNLAVSGLNVITN